MAANSRLLMWVAVALMVALIVVTAFVMAGGGGPGLPVLNAPRCRCRSRFPCKEGRGRGRMRLAQNPGDLAKLVESGDLRRLARALTRYDAVQLGAQLDNLKPHAQEIVLPHLPVERRAAALAGMRYEVAAELIGRLAQKEAAGLLDNLKAMMPRTSSGASMRPS